MTRDQILSNTLLHLELASPYDLHCHDLIVSIERLCRNNFMYPVLHDVFQICPRQIKQPAYLPAHVDQLCFGKPDLATRKRRLTFHRHLLFMATMQAFWAECRIRSLSWTRLVYAVSLGNLWETTANLAQESATDIRYSHGRFLLCAGGHGGVGISFLHRHATRSTRVHIDGRRPCRSWLCHSGDCILHAPHYCWQSHLCKSSVVHIIDCLVC